MDGREHIMILHFILSPTKTVLLIYGLLKMFSVNPNTQYSNVTGSMNLHSSPHIIRLSGNQIKTNEIDWAGSTCRV